MFNAAVEEVRNEISFYVEDVKAGTFDMPHNEYGIDVDHPFEGLFFRESMNFKYTIKTQCKLAMHS